MEKFYGTWTAITKSNYDAFIDKRFEQMDEESRAGIKKKIAEKLQIQIERGDGEDAVKTTLVCAGDAVNSMTLKLGEEQDVTLPSGMTIKGFIALEGAVLQLRQTDAAGRVSKITITPTGDNTSDMTHCIEDITATAALQKD